jgi:hypothetical protein
LGSSEGAPWAAALQWVVAMVEAVQVLCEAEESAVIADLDEIWVWE